MSVSLGRGGGRGPVLPASRRRYAAAPTPARPTASEPLPAARDGGSIGGWDGTRGPPCSRRRAGWSRGLLALAHAWHERCLADPVMNHPFSHPGTHPQHLERLAAYWGEALGGPTAFTSALGDETSVLRRHAGNGEHVEMDQRAVACFDAALTDVGITDDPLAAPRCTTTSRGPPTGWRGIRTPPTTVPDGEPLPAVVLGRSRRALSRDGGTASGADRVRPPQRPRAAQGSTGSLRARQADRTLGASRIEDPIVPSRRKRIVGWVACAALAATLGACGETTGTSEGVSTASGRYVGDDAVAAVAEELARRAAPPTTSVRGRRERPHSVAG